MQIFIQPITGPDGITEWAMIELQGELESRNLDGLGGKLVGDLHFSRDNVPMLIIGHHILQGRVQKIGKPFAVLDKVADSKGQTEYKVQAIIKKKISFTERPKPIVSLRK